jgi:sec-independent protein translocase protein TatC
MSIDEPEVDESADGRMTIWEHLAELRSRLMKVFLAIAAAAVIGWIAFPYVLSFLQRPYCDIQPNCDLLALDPLEPFMVRLKVAAYIGIALAMPVILFQIWRFVTPGLYPHERRYALPFILSSMVLFIFGATLAYVTLNPALTFLNSIAGETIETQYAPDKYITLILYMMLAFGAAFEFPVLLVALQLIGVLTPKQLLGWWRPAIVIVAVIAAVITPSQDPISMLALFVPMTILYFGAIGIGALVGRRRRKKAAKTPVGTRADG